MNPSQIQSFLESKVVACDTWGAQPSEFGGGTRRQWAEARGYSAPFTCLRDYSENGKSAAQIIYDASQEFAINPQVLIVLLQKEQGLITDTWPLSTQYKTATGYGCPDTAPCDTQYFGLTNQLRWSGRMFRAIMNASPTWYTPYVIGNNYIQYNPDKSCGGSNVNIENRATQALYNYTPYQPNSGALNAGWGTAPCGAYGNRNFYLYFTNWFGSITEQPSFSWLVESQQVSVNGNTSSANVITLAPGQSGRLIVKARNTSNQTWSSYATRIATSRPNDRVSVIQDISWISPDRPATLSEISVAPNDIGTFEFTIKAPNTPGEYKEYFNLLTEGKSWFIDQGLYYDIKVQNPSTPFYNAQIIERKLYRNANRTDEASVSNADVVKNGGKLYGLVKVKNIGNQSFEKSFTYLATASPRDRASTFQDQSWISTDRIARMQEDTVTPGQIATFYFTLSAPNSIGTYLENFGVVAEGRGWADNELASFKLRTVEPLPDAIRADTSMPADTYIRSPNLKYTFATQSDGNLVLYNNGRAIWSSNTAGRGASNLTMQSDGNLVVYYNGRATWSSNTAGLGGVSLILQDDGNLVSYSPRGAIWSTQTAGR
jgi:hypothetical protein